MNRTTRLIIVIVLLGIVYLTVRTLYPGRASAALSASECNADLWNHVYDRERLRIIAPCTAVEGRVTSVHTGNVDGDMHINLEPDDRRLLNYVNALHNSRKLIVEAVCDHPPQTDRPQAACVGFRSGVTRPQVGDRIRAVGAYVTDRDHGWREIHPVTRIDVLR